MDVEIKVKLRTWLDALFSDKKVLSSEWLEPTNEVVELFRAIELSNINDDDDNEDKNDETKVGDDNNSKNIWNCEHPKFRTNNIHSIWIAAINPAERYCPKGISTSTNSSVSHSNEIILDNKLRTGTLTTPHHDGQELKRGSCFLNLKGELNEI